MRYRAVASFAICALAAAGPLAAAQAPAAAALPNAATISGTVVTPGAGLLPNTAVQARDLLTGQVGGTAQTLSGGQFSIGGLNPGNYVIEVVDSAGQIIGTSAFIAAPAGAAVTAATVMATTGVLSAVTTTATGVVATLTATAARTVTFAAAAAGVAGVVAPPEIPVASPSR